MDVWNAGRNRWRYKEGSDEKIIEIELTQGKIALIDADRLEEIMQFRWFAAKGDERRSTHYARTEHGKRSDGTEGYMFMHVFLFPELKRPRDHIDHNGLNNTRVNIRQGTNGINERNRLSKKPHIGIVVLAHRQQYRAVWHEKNGQQRMKTFTWSKYESKEAAYTAAVSCRTENNNRVIDEIMRLQEVNPDITFAKQETISRPSNSGYKNITVRREKGKSPRAVAEITIDKNRHSKSFVASSYEGNLDNAINAANRWIDATKEGQKRRKVDASD